MNDRRKELRKKLMAFTPVYDLHPRTLLGYLGDLTLSGALVVGERPVETNRETILQIEFPKDLPDITMTNVSIPARVAWCRQDESPQYYNIGVEFIEISPENKRLFEHVLARYHFR